MLRARPMLLLLLSMLVGCVAEVPPKDSEVDSTAEDTAIAAAEGAADSAARPSVQGEIRSGETLEASFSSSAKYLGWYFQASAGQTITLDAHGVRPAGLDTVLILYKATSTGRPSGANLETNDDWGGDLSSHIELAAPETRTYVAVVRRYDRAASGRIALSFQLSGSGGASCGSRGLRPCPEGQFCNFDAAASCGRADVPGTCTPIPPPCRALARPVCGCDGMTYGNACTANAAGVSVEHEGECDSGGTACSADSDCPSLVCMPVPGRACARSVCIDGMCQRTYTCGGFAGFACPDGFWCDYPSAAMCGAGDQSGSCSPRPGSCARIDHPVCGCNGTTYPNACAANLTGTDVSHDGACEMPPPPADCRTTGCPSGRWCSWCWAHYSCIPDGALC